MTRHTLRIHREHLYAEVQVIVSGRVIAETTMDRNVTRASPEVRKFVCGVFHEPYQEKAA